MKRIIHFEIHATDPLRAIKFYTNVFSWEIKKWEGSGDDMEYWSITTGPKDQSGINGGLMKRNAKLEIGSPSGFVCTIDVPSIDEYAEKVKEQGGTIIVPKMEIPGAGWLVYCNDTEGNIFGIIESTMESSSMM